ncbi:MAG TPA: POTRA domain-containing protein [Bacteroidota bacterium]|nr:POTRA domain-containing protein [Bacteroidota bacterium]
MFLARIASIVLAVTASAFSQNITKITVSGNAAFGSREILDIIATKTASSFDSLRWSLDKDNILRRYREGGYYFAAVRYQTEHMAAESIELNIVISEGPRSDVGSILIEGNASLATPVLLDPFGTRVGAVLNPKVLEADISSIVGQYERAGFPYATVTVGDISVDSLRRLAVKLSVDEGAKTTINEIRVEGNKETSEHVIVREARISPPELYNEDKIRRIRQGLMRMNIFSRVDEPQLYAGKEGGELLLSVEEGSTNTFDGVIGYVPGNQADESGFVTGMVSVTMRNLFGTARKLDVRWQRDDRLSQEVGVQYSEPWVLDFPVNLSGSFFQRQQDSIYVRRVAGLRAELMFSDVFSAGGTLQQENIIPSTTIASQAVSNSRTLTAGVTLQYDSRDDIVAPTSGIHYVTDYLIGSKKIYSAPGPIAQHNSTVQKVSVDAELYVQPIERQVVALGMHGRQLTSDNIEVSDRFRFGGTNTLRGFRENQFIGSRVAWTNAEYRFMTGIRTFFYGFFDTGYYFLPGDDQLGQPSVQHVTYGYGVGVRVQTVIGNIGVSIALGEGDAFSEAKLHVGLMNSF